MTPSRQRDSAWQTKKGSEKDTTHLNSILCTPFLENGYIYGVCSYGQLRCLKAETGERVWETFQATTAGEPVRWANAFIVKNGDQFFLFNEGGDLIIADLTPKGYEEISRAAFIGTSQQRSRPAGGLVSPGICQSCVYARNDNEIICANLAKKP